MLYKKNISKTLDDSLFKNPTGEYRAAPFFSWNCKLTRELLEKQIDNMKAMGYGGFHMHVRAGMDTYYLGDDYLSLIRACTEKAKREGMLAWLYDEDRWPSGAAGGFVTRDPAFRSRFLGLVPASHLKVSEDRRSYLGDGVTPLYDISNEASKTRALAQGLPYYIATYDILLDENGDLARYERISRNAAVRGERYVAFSDVSHSDRFNGYPYVDALNPKAIQKFIEITHEKFKECVGDEFDKTVPAIFTDEPQYHREDILGFANEKKLCKVAWTGDFEASYKRTYGSDIIDNLPEIFWNLSGGKMSVARYRFHDHLCQRFTDGFSRTCGKWCDKNGIKLTGHVMEEVSLHSQTAAVGEAMRAYEYFGYPGIDMLCNATEFTTAKQAQSAVHQYGKEAMISELYGVTNWNFDFRGHKFQGDWQAALGVTVRVPHLTWVSMKGDAKRDYPASFNYHSPWYREYPYIEDHFARLNTALTRGTPSVNVGVIHPIESYWLCHGPVASSRDIRAQMDKNFFDFIDWMLFGCIDFDYISESSIPKLCKYKSRNRQKPTLKVGKMEYETIIVPSMLTIRGTTLEVLKQFRDAGGRVIFMGSCPTHMDAVESNMPRELFDVCESIPFDRYSLLKALSRERVVEIREASGALTENLIHQMRDDGDYRWLFICNARTYEKADVVGAQRLNIKIKGRYRPLLYNTVTGDIEEISYRVENGNTLISTTRYFHDSLLLKLERLKLKDSSLEVSSRSFETVSSTTYTKPMDFALDEPNVLLLDIGEYRYNDEKEFMGPLDSIFVRDAVRRALGIKVTSGYQPWALKEEPYTDVLERRFVINSEIPVKGACLAAEDVEISEFYFDGQKLSGEPVGYFTDEAIKTVKLPDFEAGDHEIRVKMPFGARTNVENMFVLGDFGTRVCGSTATITARPQKLCFGNVVNQGFSFYGSSVTYKIPVKVDEDGCGLRVHCNFYRGPMIRVSLDGEIKGNIVFAPYDLVIENVEKGEHTLELKLFGNRFNSFAALHNTHRKVRWSGPGMWKTRGDEYSNEYHLDEFGIITSPVISVIREKK